MKVAQSLRDSGLRVESASTAGTAEADGILDVSMAGQHARFAVEERGRAPYPHEVQLLERPLRQLAPLGHPLLVVPFVSESLGALLTGAGWSWADAQGNFDLRAPGLLVRQRRATDAPPRRASSLPRGPGSFSVIRTLVRGGSAAEAPGASALAATAGITQPRASQVLRHLHDLGLVERGGHGRWRPHQQALLDRFLAEYPGPGGSVLFCYSLDPLVDVAVRASQASTPGRPVTVSADVGPDLIAPWRRPSHLILYTADAIEPASLSLVIAQGPHDANVTIRMPADRSVFPVPVLTAQVRGKDVYLADPIQQIWDLEDLGGADRAEAAGRMREWLLAPHRPSSRGTMTSPAASRRSATSR